MAGQDNTIPVMTNSSNCLLENITITAICLCTAVLIQQLLGRFVKHAFHPWRPWVFVYPVPREPHANVNCPGMFRANDTYTCTRTRDGDGSTCSVYVLGMQRHTAVAANLKNNSYCRTVWPVVLSLKWLCTVQNSGTGRPQEASHRRYHKVIFKLGIITMIIYICIFVKAGCTERFPSVELCNLLFNTYIFSVVIVFNFAMTDWIADRPLIRVVSHGRWASNKGDLPWQVGL